MGNGNDRIPPHFMSIFLFLSFSFYLSLFLFTFLFLPFSFLLLFFQVKCEMIYATYRTSDEQETEWGTTVDHVCHAQSGGGAEEGAGVCLGEGGELVVDLESVGGGSGRVRKREGGEKAF